MLTLENLLEMDQLEIKTMKQDNDKREEVLIDLQASVDFLRDLQSEWAWKRNTIPKNNREMTELDGLVERIDRRLKPNRVTGGK